MTSNIALDTSVLIYLHDNSNPRKRDISKSLLADNPMISSQVISEYLNTTRRLLSFTKEELLINTSALFLGCPIIQVVPETLLFAASLVKKYHFQLFDAIIVASSADAGCKTLYSEDMQHGLIVNKKMTILNPFHLM